MKIIHKEDNILKNIKLLIHSSDYKYNYLRLFSSCLKKIFIFIHPLLPRGEIWRLRQLPMKVKKENKHCRYMNPTVKTWLKLQQWRLHPAWIIPLQIMKTMKTWYYWAQIIIIATYRISRHSPYPAHFSTSASLYFTTEHLYVLPQLQQHIRKDEEVSGAL